MTYEMNAEGDNGVTDTTTLGALTGFADRKSDSSVQESPQDGRWPAVLRVSGNDAVATGVRGDGGQNSPGVVGHGGSNGVGVMGLGGSRKSPGVLGLANDGTPSFPNQVDEGSGVQGRATRLGTYGVLGTNDTGTAVAAFSVRGFGLEARSVRDVAVNARSHESTAIVGRSEFAGRQPGEAGGVLGIGGRGFGVAGESHDADGVRGRSVEGIGVHGIANQRDGGHGRLPGVLGEAVYGAGVEGRSAEGVGVSASSESGPALRAESSSTSDALFARSLGSGVNANAIQAVSQEGAGIVATSRDFVGGLFGGGRAAIQLIPAEHIGPPATGEHGLGELVLDAAGALFFCVSATTPASAAVWKQVMLV